VLAVIAGAANTRSDPEWVVSLDSDPRTWTRRNDEKTLLLLAMLVAGTALVAQPPTAGEARLELLNAVWESPDSELLDLYRGFAMVEHDPDVRAAAAGLTGVDVADLDPAPPLDVHPVDARNWLLEMIEDSEDGEVLAMAGHLERIEAEVEPFATALVLASNKDDKDRKKKHDHCLDHLPKTLVVPGSPGRPGFRLPTAGVVKACEHQSPLRCRGIKRIVRYQIKKHTGAKRRFH